MIPYVGHFVYTKALLDATSCIDVVVRYRGKRTKEIHRDQHTAVHLEQIWRKY